MRRRRARRVDWLERPSVSEHRYAFDVPDSELAAYQRAMRLLLRHAVVTATYPGTEELELVRRWAPQMGRDLSAAAGYRLEHAQSVVRLVRKQDWYDATHGLETNGGKPFDRRRYAYLCLALAALGRSGNQITLTELVERTAALASEIEGLRLDPDDYTHRVTFADAVSYLERLGALAIADGSTVSWQRDPGTGEALYDIDRDVCHLLFSPQRILQRLRSAAGLFEEELPVGRDARRTATRQRLLRLLLERPAIYYDDLTEADRKYAQNESRELAADLARLTGGQLERRAEGLALIDTTGTLSDRRFPGTGTVPQVALLLAERLAGSLEGRSDVRRPGAAETHQDAITRLDRVLPTRQDVEPLVTDYDPAGDAAGETETPPDVRSPLIDDAWIAAAITDIVGRHGRTLAAEYRADPSRLAREAISALEAFELVRTLPGGCVPLPAVARYRRVHVQIRSSTGPTE